MEKAILGKHVILGIETSCDETAVALYDGTQAYSLVFTQMLHAQYGGVVPEMAARLHLLHLPVLMEQLWQETGWNWDNHRITAIAYTHGPGLLGALLMGAAFAKTWASALGIPAIGIHHLEGHLLAPQLDPNPPPYPHLALLVSGGHTQLIGVSAPGQYQILGESLDDAAGEAFDKIAKLLGFPFPGGKHLAAWAEKGNRHRFAFSQPLMGKPGLNFSFSGLKTQVRQTIDALRQANGELSDTDKADVAASFQHTVVQTLLGKIKRALLQWPASAVVLSGGVAANEQLRNAIRAWMEEQGGQAYFPSPELCTDNAAMIAYAGWLHWTTQGASSADSHADVRVFPRCPLPAYPPSLASALLER